jgi:hypothetical protein
MSNEIMTVGSIRTTVNPSSGIYEALLEKAERERDEARAVLKVVEQAHHAALYREGELKRECAEACEESREQARLLGKGSEREARLITERDHYKQAIEEISTTIQDWLDSLVQEPSLDFIHAIKAWADKKLKEI